MAEGPLRAGDGAAGGAELQQLYWECRSHAGSEAGDGLVGLGGVGVFCFVIRWKKWGVEEGR